MYDKIVMLEYSLLFILIQWGKVLRNFLTLSLEMILKVKFLPLLDSDGVKSGLFLTNMLVNGT